MLQHCLFYVLVFWPRGRWDLSSPTRDGTRTPCIGRQSLNHWTAMEVPCNLDINPLSDTWLANIFSHPVGCFFTLLIVSFDAGILKFDTVPFIYFCFCCTYFWHYMQGIIAKSNVMKLFPYVFF